MLFCNALGISLDISCASLLCYNNTPKKHVASKGLKNAAIPFRKSLMLCEMLLPVNAFDLIRASMTFAIINVACFFTSIYFGILFVTDFSEFVFV